MSSGNGRGIEQGSRAGFFDLTAITGDDVVTEPEPTQVPDAQPEIPAGKTVVKEEPSGPVVTFEDVTPTTVRNTPTVDATQLAKEPFSTGTAPATPMPAPTPTPAPTPQAPILNARSTMPHATRVRIENQLKSVLTEINENQAQLSAYRNQFLDPIFLNRARIVHATTPAFMDEEFTAVFNRLCETDELLEQKLDLLSCESFEFEGSVPVRLEEFLQDYRASVQIEKEKYLTQREEFQAALETQIDELPANTDRFKAYLKGLKPTFPIPLILPLMGSVNLIKGEITGAGTPLFSPLKTFSWGDADPVSLLVASQPNLIERIGNWWSNASSKVKVAVVGAIALVGATTVGGIAWSVISGDSSESMAGADTQAQESDTGMTPTELIQDRPTTTVDGIIVPVVPVAPVAPVIPALPEAEVSSTVLENPDLAPPQNVVPDPPQSNIPANANSVPTGVNPISLTG